MNRERGDVDDGAAFESIVGPVTRLFAASVTVMDREGNVSEGFGEVYVRAGEGRGFSIQLTENLSGYQMTVELDWGRPRRARVNLQADALRDAIERASREQGLSSPPPEVE